jgi:hypothetical protein
MTIATIADSSVEGVPALSMADAFTLLEENGLPCAPFADLPVDRPVEPSGLFGLAFPVAVKFDSPLVPHKTEAGLVILGCADVAAVEEARRLIVDRVGQHYPDLTGGRLLVQQMARGTAECIIGLNRDPVVGPVVVFGTGGVTVELFADVAMRVLPLAAWDFDEMLAELRGGALLTGFRGRPAGDMAALKALLHGIADLFGARPEIRSIDLNPVIVNAAGVQVVDALVEVAPQDGNGTAGQRGN